MKTSRDNRYRLSSVRRSHSISLKRCFIDTACRIRKEFGKAELEYYDEEVAEVGDLIYLLEAVLIPRHFGSSMLQRVREVQPPCRGVEPEEHLNIASLLIDAYCFLETECHIAVTECRYSSLDDINGWEWLNKGFRNAVYGVMLRADSHLATLWRKGDITWQELADEIDKKRLTL